MRDRLELVRRLGGVDGLDQRVEALLQPPAVVVREWRLPAPERRAARAERRVEAQMRLEREAFWTPERRAAALEAERRKWQFFPG